jgi:hypothetical protein
LDLLRPRRSNKPKPVITELITNELIIKLATSVLKILASQISEASITNELRNWQSLVIIINLWQQIIFKNSNAQTIQLLSSYNDLLKSKS